MEIVFIDPEPPSAAGGGIRTYINLALKVCRAEGVASKVYSHNPQGYPEGSATSIGRRPWLRSPFRGLAYRLLHSENALWEHAYWLERELAASDAPGRVYEFGDFLGYGFFALRNPALRPRCQVRIHTPAFLIGNGVPPTWRGKLAAHLSEWRERDCLSRAPALPAPSAVFVREKLPWLRGWEHVPNPLPDRPNPSTVSTPLRTARAVAHAPRPADPAPAIPPASGDEAWSAAAPDAADIAAAARAAAIPANILPTRFLYLGRVEERKGVAVLVRAFARLAEERPFASLTLVGGAGPAAYARSVRDLIAAQPPAIGARLTWEPPCPPEARDALFARFTALTAPSLWENSPYVYFEAMAAGLSCIGSATGEMKAVAEATGALSPRPGDEEDWLKALRAHCDGLDARVPAAQAAYLAQRRAEIPARLLAAWRKSAGEAATSAGKLKASADGAV